MSTVTVDEMIRDPRGIIERVEAGETLVITEAQIPVAELKPIAETKNGLRPFGLCKGEFIVPDDFDQPLPEEILREFEGR